MYKAGTITLVAPGLEMALAASGTNKWLVPQNRRGYFFAGPAQPELKGASTDTVQHLPKQDEIIYFLVDENDPAAVKLWATKQEYEAALETTKRRKELEQIQKELAARPKIRVLEQLFKREVPIGEPVVLLPEVLREDFLKKYPVVYDHDRFTTSGDFLQKRERWFEERTLEGWVQTPDPRRKSRTG